MGWIDYMLKYLHFGPNREWSRACFGSDARFGGSFSDGGMGFGDTRWSKQEAGSGYCNRYLSCHC